MIVCPIDSLCGGGEHGIICNIDRYHNGELIAEDSFARRRFFFLAKLSRPLSVFESLLSESLDELEPDDDDDDEELDPLELSDARPVLSFKLTCSAISASSGSLSCCQADEPKLAPTWRQN